MCIRDRGSCSSSGTGYCRPEPGPVVVDWARGTTLHLSWTVAHPELVSEYRVQWRLDGGEWRDGGCFDDVEAELTLPHDVVGSMCHLRVQGCGEKWGVWSAATEVVVRDEERDADEQAADVPTLGERVRTMVQLHAEDRILMAKQEALGVREILRERPEMLEEEREPVLDALGVQCISLGEVVNERIERILRVSADVEQALEEVELPDGWELVSEKPAMRVYQRGSPDGLVEVKTESWFDPKPGQLVQDFVNLLSLFAEVDLLPRWFPRGLLRDAEEIAAPSLFHKIAHFKLKLPVISDRDAVVDGHGYDLSERRTALIRFQSIENSSHVQVPDPTQDFVRIAMHGCYYLKLCTSGRVHFKQVLHADAKLKLLPNFIMNKISTIAVPSDIVSQLHKTHERFDGSEWQQRVRINPRLYGCLLYTSDAADEEDSVDLGGRRIIKKKNKKQNKKSTVKEYHKIIASYDHQLHRTIHIDK
eukprot:TRINITY_DN25316_c0_g1_i1.p1 TRINITY_DN25316_c0_g1~~TRINITY_DN25316_c0_g1_i1.p1  ORF type:complete len:476 (-),score=93.98 TRINITY_DN25316_c0_g1_i1:10-1437(-)